MKNKLLINKLIRLYKEELYYVICTPHPIFFLSSRMRKAEHVARMEKKTSLREGGHLAGLVVDGERVFKKWEGGMDWTDVALDRDRWWALVNAVINIRVP
jgi:hypothetical protein